MAKFVAGDIIVVPFPFSDLSEAKRRPALVIKPVVNDDLILCQITSRFKSDEYSIPLVEADFADGALPLQSYIRPNRLFTADEKIILYKAGSLKSDKMTSVIDRLIEILKQ